LFHTKLSMSLFPMVVSKWSKKYIVYCICICFKGQSIHCNGSFWKYRCSLRRWSVGTETCQGTKMWNSKSFNSHTGRNCVIFLIKKYTIKK
jgi:hypothetical protein